MVAGRFILIFDSEEACRAIHRFTCKVGGRVETLVIDQDSVFVGKEIYGEVFEVQKFGGIQAETWPLG